MFKKCLSILLGILLMVVSFSVQPFTVLAQEVDIMEDGENVELTSVGGNYGVNLSHAGYQSPPNPYAYPQCTWYCWGRAYEKLGLSLPGWGNANTWDESADANPNFTVGTEARANSIMVENSTGVGHVMFVEKVENGYAYITEGNYLSSSYHEDRINLSRMVRDSWTTHQLSSVRYIYLDGEPIEPTAPSINVCVNAPEVDISWNDVGAYGYYVYVENRDTQNIPYSNDLGRSFSVHLGLSEGHWRVYVMAMYSNNEIKSSSYDFDIRIEAPTVSVSVSIPTVDISWNDVGAYGYYVYVENRDTQNIPYSDDLGRSFSVHLGLSEGHWRVYVMAMYSNNEIKSSSYDFDIRIEAPTVNVSVSIPTVDISWDDVGASSYYLYVQNRDTQNIPYSNNIGKNCFIHLGLSNGNWRAYVTAVYSEDLMKSSYVDFTIGDNVVPTTPPTEHPTTPPIDTSLIILGDVDGDEEVTIIDATCIQRKLASIPTAKYIEAAADTDEDDEITIVDATTIQRWLAQLPSNDKIGKPIS